MSEFNANKNEENSEKRTYFADKKKNRVITILGIVTLVIVLGMVVLAVI